MCLLSGRRTKSVHYWVQIYQLNLENVTITMIHKKVKV